MKYCLRFRQVSGNLPEPVLIYLRSTSVLLDNSDLHTAVYARTNVPMHTKAEVCVRVRAGLGLSAVVLVKRRGFSQRAGNPLVLFFRVYLQYNLSTLYRCAFCPDTKADGWTGFDRNTIKYLSLFSPKQYQRKTSCESVETVRVEGYRLVRSTGNSGEHADRGIRIP